MTLEEKLEHAADLLCEASRTLEESNNEQREQNHIYLRRMWKEFYLVIAEVKELEKREACLAKLVTRYEVLSKSKK